MCAKEISDQGPPFFAIPKDALLELLDALAAKMHAWGEARQSSRAVGRDIETLNLQHQL